MENDMSERPRTVRELLAEAEHFLPENMSCPEAKEFAEAVAKQLRAEYAPKVATGVEWYIYRKEEPFAMGYVGYADYKYSGDTEKTYTVFSRKIQNAKYGHGRMENSASTKHFDKAVKNARRYLVPYTLPEIIKATRSDARDKFGQLKHDANNASKHSRTLLVQSFMKGEKSSLEAELRHLLDTGHTFVNDSFKADLVNMFAEWDESRTRERENPAADVVYIKQTRTGVQVGVMPTVNMTSYFWSNAEAQDYTWYTQEDTPQHILEGITKLNMVPSGHFVDGVGYRPEHLDNVYYVYAQ
jgi:hypothetical protein